MDTVDLARLEAHCLGKPGVTPEHPFGPDALVMKVAGKMFAILGENDQPPTVSVKCDPGLAEILRETYPAVVPGYHLSKRHWNTVTLDGTVPADEVLSWIDDSYDLVVVALPQRVRREIAGQT